MTWRDILVHLKAHEDWSEHIEVAIRLAKTFNARLTGLWTSRQVATIKQYLGATSDAALKVEARETVLAAEAEQRFRQALKANGVDGDWDTGEGDASEILMLAGRVHDLIVVEQRHEGFDETGWDVAETCAVSSGTPTLAVPFEGPFLSVGERVLIARNGSQQAAAAVHEAMPLIRSAKHVTVLIGRGKESLSSITRYPRMDIVGYLERHAARSRHGLSKPMIGKQAQGYWPPQRYEFRRRCHGGVWSSCMARAFSWRRHAARPQKHDDPGPYGSLLSSGVVVAAFLCRRI